MKALGYLVIVLSGIGLGSTQVLASSSISTRVKVVEEKVRVHDKKLRELSAQQELASQQLIQLQQARIEAEKAAQAHAEAVKKRAQVKVVVQKDSKSVSAKTDSLASNSKPQVQLHAEPANYAFP